MEEAAESCEEIEQRNQALNDLMKLELDFRKIFMELKLYSWQGGSNGSTAATSLNSLTRRCSNGLSILTR
jgi:hypothetical protein